MYRSTTFIWQFKHFFLKEWSAFLRNFSSKNISKDRKDATAYIYMYKNVL